MLTFRDFFNKIQTLENLKGDSKGNGGIFKLDNTWGFQIYDGRQQVNIGQLWVNGKGIDSWANFVFDPGEHKMTMFSCPSAGVCNYQSGKQFDLDQTITFPYPINNGAVVRSVIRDFMGSSWERTEEPAFPIDEDGEIDIQLSIDVIRSEDGKLNVVCIENAQGSIPFYTELTSISASARRADEGLWEWLKHFIPNLTFWTAEFDKYLLMNHNEGSIRTAVLGKRLASDCTTIEHLMGVYLVDGRITAQDENTIMLIEKVGYLVREYIAGTPLSFFDKYSGIDSLLVSEENILQLLLANNDTDDDEDE